MIWTLVCCKLCQLEAFINERALSSLMTLLRKCHKTNMVEVECADHIMPEHNSFYCLRNIYLLWPYPFFVFWFFLFF